MSLAASIWGGMYVVSKYVLYYIPPITLVWLRYVIAGLVLYILLHISRRKSPSPIGLTKRDWLLLCWIGFIGYFVSICLQFIGTKLSDAHTGSLITSATPAFIVIFGRIVLKERIDLRKIISLILATIGVITVIGWHMQIGSFFWGTIILVGAAVTWALLSVYVKVASNNLSSLAITTYAVLFATAFTTPCMLWEVRTETVLYHSTFIILGILYLGAVSTAGAFFLWNKGMEMMDAGVGSLFFFFQPIVGSVLGWLLLGEHLGRNFFIGGMLIVLGVLIETVRIHPRSFLQFFD